MAHDELNTPSESPLGVRMESDVSARLSSNPGLHVFDGEWSEPVGVASLNDRYLPDHWAVRASPSTSGRTEFGSFSIGQYGYLCAGWRPAAALTQNSCKEYDSQADSWTFIAPVPILGIPGIPGETISSRMGPMGSQSGTAGYLIGGEEDWLDDQIPRASTGNIDKYTRESQAWASAAVLPPPGRWGGNAAPFGDSIYVYGGIFGLFTNTGNASTLMQRFTPQSGVTETLQPNLFGFRETAATAIGQAMYIFGGRNPDHDDAVSRVDKFNLSGWSVSFPLIGGPREAAVAGTIQGYGYLSGGRKDFSPSGHLNATDRFDPATGWVFKQNMIPPARSNHGGTVI